MVFVCPNPQPWNEIYSRLKQEYEKRDEIEEKPPVPLILNGWVFSSDLEKKVRWEETISWAKKNNLTQLIPVLTDGEKYYVEKMSIIASDPYGFEE